MTNLISTDAYRVRIVLTHEFDTVYQEVIVIDRTRAYEIGEMLLEQARKIEDEEYKSSIVKCISNIQIVE